MNTHRNFSCPLTKYSLEYVINTTTRIALLNEINSDYKNIKGLCSLIRTSIDKLQKENIDTIIQFVAFSEWELYLKDKTTWKITHSDISNQVHTISCPANNFLENYGIGIGLI